MVRHFEARSLTCIGRDLTDGLFGVAVEVDVLGGSAVGASDVVVMSREPLGQLVPGNPSSVMESRENAGG